MSLGNFRLLDLALAAVCLVLLLLSGFLLLRVLKRKKQCAQLQKDLELQKKRVLARKEKIWELRGKMRELFTRLSEDEEKLMNSYTQEEIALYYPEIVKELRQLMRAADVASLPRERQADAMSSAIKLSHLLQSAFRMPEDTLLDAEGAGQTGATDGKSIIPSRVLIVDDNEESRRFSAEIVESSGFLAELAANGEAAVEKVRVSREGYYDLILMDIMMYGKNGYETCREIRNLPRADCDRIPIIALTANSFSEDHLQMVDAGMNDRISKPISRELFMDIADKWLHRQWVNAAAGDTAAWSSIRTSDGSAATASY